MPETWEQQRKRLEDCLPSLGSEPIGLAIRAALSRLDEEFAKGAVAVAHELLAELKNLCEKVALLEGVEIPYPIAIPLGIALKAAEAAIAKIGDLS